VTRTLAQSLAWAADGAAHLRGMMMRMGADAFAAPSALPGWTRAHVLTHVARNADAMVNLITWARTGVRTPAYPSREHRDAEIEAGAQRAPDEIRADLLASSDRLAAVVRGTPASAWSATVEAPRGGEMPASEILWFRAREVWVHAVDLDAGASFADLPRPMLHELLTDATTTFAARPDFPRLVLRPTDEARSWSVGVDGSGTGAPGDGADGASGGVTEVRGPAAELAAWLLGRSKGRSLRTAEGKRPGPLPGWM
jgi:maleylpyruvate isomerase